MNDTEEKIVELQRHSITQDARISNFETKFEMFMQSVQKSLEEMRERDKIRAAEIRELDKIRADEMRDFKNEMRTQNILRAKEIAELNQKIEHAQEIHNADMKEVNDRIESKFDKLSGQIQNIVIAAVVGVGAVVVGVVSFVVSIVNK